MIVYLSGPISGDPDFREAFANAKKDLEEEGVYEVINPAVLVDLAPPGVLGYEDYMSMDEDMICKADVLVLLPGWQKSPGCNRELGFAEALGKTVYEYSKDGGHFGAFKGWRPV